MCFRNYLSYFPIETLTTIPITADKSVKVNNSEVKSLHLSARTVAGTKHTARSKSILLSVRLKSTTMKSDAKLRLWKLKFYLVNRLTRLTTGVLKVN